MSSRLRSRGCHSNPARRKWRGKVLALTSQATLLMLLLTPLPAMAQLLRPEVSQPFLANPLLDAPLDPFLPRPQVPRPLSPLEQQQLAGNLDGLNQSALLALQAGQVETAFAAWRREVRLRRLLGLPQEIAAIQRVGRFAWEAGRTEDVQLLTARLRQIRLQLEATAPLDQALAVETARGFEILGEPNDAIALYRQLATLAQAAGNLAGYRTYLETIAGLESAWFQFPAAATTYRELYQLLAGQASPLSVLYLQQEITSLEQAQQFDRAVEVQQELLAIYQANQVLDPVPELQRATAQNFQVLGNLEAASRFYQAAYTNAITLEQFEIASQVIAELAPIYQALNRWDDVIYLYQQRLLVNRQVYDAYGIMENFDQLGQIYEQLGQRSEALAAFQEGWILATHLGHRQDYFIAQIQRLSAVPPVAPTEPIPEDPTLPPPATLPL